MALTASEKTLLLLRFGDTSQTLYTDAELDLFWDTVGGASDTTQRYEAALYMMFESLLNSSTKLHDYSAGATDEKLSQIVKNLQERASQYKPSFDAALNQKADFASLTLRPRPHTYRRPPNTRNYRNGQRRSVGIDNFTLDDRDY